MNEQIEQWSKRIKEIESIVDPLLEERSGLLNKIMEVNSPFKIGDVIEWVVGKVKWTGEVIRIAYFVKPTLCWEVKVIRKDGSYGACKMAYHYNFPTLCKHDPRNTVQPAVVEGSGKYEGK